MNKKLFLLFCIFSVCVTFISAQKTDSDNSWTRISGALTWISAGQDGTVWGVNSAGNIFRRSGTGWDQISGSLVQISVGSASNIWGVDGSDNIYKLP